MKTKKNEKHTNEQTAAAVQPGQQKHYFGFNNRATRTEPMENKGKQAGKSYES